MTLFLDSEKVSPTGNVTSTGIINQLGRPSLEPPAVLVREAVQNSWDARASRHKPVRFSMVGWTLNSHQVDFLRSYVLADIPPAESLPISETLLRSGSTNVLAISDRGTNGLGGPTRADVVTHPDESRDFVDFLRNVGQPPNRQLAGGTYGYGKAALYRASRTKTICVYTRCKVQDKAETRFMVSALGEPYSTSHDRYTGRHWWGRLDDGIAEPLLDDEADAIAETLGLPNFTDDELGTTILILDPILGEEAANDESHEISPNRTPLQAFNLMAEYILWYFWPKMLHYDHGVPDIIFELSWQGKRIHLPPPEDFPPLQGYVQAMYGLKEFPFDPDSPFRLIVEDIASQRPKQHLGRLALQQFPITSAKYFDTGTNESPFTGLTHHTALMRQPELIVKYVSGAASPNERLGYAGVFITDPEVDPVFAESEPPTHDDWISQSLENRWHKRYVNVALSEIGKRMDAFAKPPVVRTNARGLTPLGAFAARLGSSLIPAEQGPAATSKPFTVRPTQPQQKRQTDQPSPSPVPPPHFALTKPTPAKPLGPGYSSGDSRVDPGANGNLPIIEPMSFGGKEYGGLSEAPNRPFPSSGSEAGVETPPQPYVFNPPQYEPPTTPPIHRPKPIIGKARVKYINDTYVLVDGVPALQFEFAVSHAGNSSGTSVRVSARAVLDGSQLENDPPIGGSAAQVMHWVDPQGMIYASSDEIFIGLEPAGNWYVIISLPEDMMVGVEFKAEARAAE